MYFQHSVYAECASADCVHCVTYSVHYCVLHDHVLCGCETWTVQKQHVRAQTAADGDVVSEKSGSDEVRTAIDCISHRLIKAESSDGNSSKEAENMESIGI